MNELRQAEKAHNDLYAEFRSAGGHAMISTDNGRWKEWYYRLVAAWHKVLVLRGDATKNADGTVTIHNTGRLFSASGAVI